MIHCSPSWWHQGYKIPQYNKGTLIQLKALYELMCLYLAEAAHQTTYYIHNLAYKYVDHNNTLCTPPYTIHRNDFSHNDMCYCDVIWGHSSSSIHCWSARCFFSRSVWWLRATARQTIWVYISQSCAISKASFKLGCIPLKYFFIVLSYVVGCPPLTIL